MVGKITDIQAVDTYPLRHRILGHGESMEDVARPGDDEALHFGHFRDGEINGIISLYPQDQSQEFTQQIWRIRGMAVDENLQGQGIGGQLLKHAESYLHSRYDTQSIWCNARKKARRFYEKHGYRVVDEIYITFPYEGYSYRMIKDFS